MNKVQKMAKIFGQYKKYAYLCSVKTKGKTIEVVYPF